MIRLIPLVLLGVFIFTMVMVSHNRPTITEDSPRWDCYTMGNLECGE